MSHHRKNIFPSRHAMLTSILFIYLFLHPAGVFLPVHCLVLYRWVLRCGLQRDWIDRKTFCFTIIPYIFAYIYVFMPGDSSFWVFKLGCTQYRRYVVMNSETCQDALCCYFFLSWYSKCNVLLATWYHLTISACSVHTRNTGCEPCNGFLFFCCFSCIVCPSGLHQHNTKVCTQSLHRAVTHQAIDLVIISNLISGLKNKQSQLPCLVKSWKWKHGPQQEQVGCWGAR